MLSSSDEGIYVRLSGGLIEYVNVKFLDNKWKGTGGTRRYIYLNNLNFHILSSVCICSKSYLEIFNDFIEE